MNTITTFSPAGRRMIQAIGIIGLALGLGGGGTFNVDQMRTVLLLSLFGCAIGGYLLFVSIETPARNLKAQGCGVLGFSLGLGMGGTFPDGTEWVTWLLCVFWGAVGVMMLVRRPTTA